MQNYNMKAIGETILMSVILAMLILLNVYSLGMVQLIIFLIPLPVSIIYVRYNFKYALICMAIALLLGSVFATPISAALTWLMFLIPTAAFCYSYKKQFKFSKAFIIITVAYVIAIIFEYTGIIKIESNTTFIQIVNYIVSSAQASMNSVEKVYIDAGMNKQQVDEILDILRQTFTKSNILMIVPGLLGVVSIISAYLLCFIGGKIFNKLGVESNYNIKIYNIYTYNLVLAFSIIAVCIGLLLRSRNILIGSYIYYTVALTVGLWLLASGLSLIIYYLKSKTKLKNGIIALIVIFTFILFQSVGYMYMIVGFVDSFVDIRKIGRKKGGKEQGEK
ncbi:MULTISPECIES: DUF2232 domain-containing protein [Clostridium]|uniref:DUF2232 domain-containing protein n=1 Tax=Clostridium TaxID=1485 RepID=UPI00082664BE|nr:MULTISPECIES: DUF2232 domain-containing protein [Clostridium]PJI08378.1 DUF2232 domain-containing protein [Clostridium sp. CT7]